MHVVGRVEVVVSATFCAVVSAVVSAAGAVPVLPPAGVVAGGVVGVVGVAGVGVGVGVVVGVVGGVLVWVVHRVVASVRSVLVLARSESAWRTVVSRAFWAAVIEAVEPAPECDEPVVPVVLPVPVLVLLLPVPVLAVPVLAVPVLPTVLAVLLLVVPVLPVPAAVVPVLPVPAAVVPVLPVPAAVVPVLLPVPDAAETWPDSAWAKVRSALATWLWADARAYFKDVLSSVARTWPAVTFWPMVTGTVATVPDTAKDTVAALDGSVVPVACRLCKTECEPALAVTYVGVVLREVA
jgi:hypothetical protein